MLDDENDKRIKEAADNYHPEYDDTAWEKMEQLLDEHLPAEKEIADEPVAQLTRSEVSAFAETAAALAAYCTTVAIERHRSLILQRS